MGYKRWKLSAKSHQWHKMMFRCVIFAAVAAVSVCGRYATSPNGNNLVTEENEIPDDKSGSYMGDLYYLYKVYRKCAASDTSSCLKKKLVTAIDRMDKYFPQLKLMDGVAFVKEDDPLTYEKPMSEADIDAVLAKTPNEKDETLNSLIADKVSNFFSTHKLQVKLPTSSDLQRSFVEEGRKKKKKPGSSGSIMIPAMVAGGMLIPIALGVVSVFAGKALLVSVLALTLSSLMGLRKLFGPAESTAATSTNANSNANNNHQPHHGHRHHGHHDYVHPEYGPKLVVNEQHDEYRYPDKEDEGTAQDIAYNSYAERMG